MWELDYKESWAPKNWCFELWCWQRLLWVLWIARRSNQSILKEINPEYSLEELMLKLKLQYLATDEKSWLIWKDPDAGKDLRQEEQRTTEDVMVGCHHWLNWHEFEKNPGSWWWIWRPGMLQSMGSQRVGHDWETELNWLNHVPIIAWNCNYLFLFVWLLIVKTDKHLLLLWLCNYYSLNTIVSWLVNRKIMEF